MDERAAAKRLLELLSHDAEYLEHERDMISKARRGELESTPFPPKEKRTTMQQSPLGQPIDPVVLEWLRTGATSEELEAANRALGIKEETDEQDEGEGT